MKLIGSFRFFAVALVAVFVVVILVNPGATSAAQRVHHLETIIRCPSCEGISVADSGAPSALAVRNEIVQSVAAGNSDEQIISSLESRYGSSILLVPATTGVGVLLWLVPVLVLVGVLFGYSVIVRRRQ